MSNTSDFDCSTRRSKSLTKIAVAAAGTPENFHLRSKFSASVSLAMKSFYQSTSLHFGVPCLSTRKCLVDKQGSMSICTTLIFKILRNCWTENLDRSYLFAVFEFGFMTFMRRAPTNHSARVSRFCFVNQ